MFRFAVLALAFMALGALVFGGAGTGFGAGWLLLVPFLFLFKLMLFVAIFAAIGRMMWHGGSHRHRPMRRPRWEHTPQQDRRRSEADRFEEWHRLAHAREEVDSWVPELGDDDENA